MSTTLPSSSPTPPIHLPPTILYPSYTSIPTTPTPSPPAPSSPRPPKRRTAAKALHFLSTAYVPSLLFDERSDLDPHQPNSEARTKVADTGHGPRRPASPSSSGSGSDFAPTATATTHNSLVSLRLAKRKRKRCQHTKAPASASSSDSSAMSDFASGARLSGMNNRRRGLGKGKSAVRGKGNRGTREGRLGKGGLESGCCRGERG